MRPFVEARAPALADREDARIAVAELEREPAARIFAQAHGRPALTSSEAFLRSVLMPLLVRAAEACEGFDWEDGAFEQAYAELELTLFGAGRAYAAVAPLVGMSAAAPADLGGGVRVRVPASGELASLWPEARGLLPADFGREVDRMWVLELERELPAGATELPDAPGELSDAVTALRLATAGPIAAGPVLFERLDWRPLGVRPVLPIAASPPAGEPVRLDGGAARLAGALLLRLAEADDDPALEDALERYELSLFGSQTFRAEQLRESLLALLGEGDGWWAASLRASLLSGQELERRARVLSVLSALGRDADVDEAGEAIRRTLAQTLVYGNRAGLVRALDRALLAAGSERPEAERLVAVAG